MDITIMETSITIIATAINFVAFILKMRDGDVRT